MHLFRSTRKKYEAKSPQTVKKMCPSCGPQTLQNSQRFQESLHYKKHRQIRFMELHNVVEHLLLVPKKHTENLKALGDKERLEMMSIIAEYESEGHNIYARGVENERRSIVHLHSCD